MTSDVPDDTGAQAARLYGETDEDEGPLTDGDDPDGDGESGNLYELGASLIMPHVFLHGIPRPPLTDADRAGIEHGILCLELWREAHSDSWQALWVMGKAHQRLGRSERAGELFLRSHEENPRHPDVARELVMECIALGRGVEAVHFARTAVELDPDDPTLLVNLALALLISGQVNEALLQVNQALARDPSDEVTANVAGFILDVSEGRREQPTKLSKFPGPS